MREKISVAILIFTSGLTFAAPISSPKQPLDSPILSGGGFVGARNCKAYQSNDAAVDLRGGELLLFYGAGTSVNNRPVSFGGYLSTKNMYSGTAYMKVRGGAVGLFARNSINKNDFIAGAGGGGTGYYSGGDFYIRLDTRAASGGGWSVSGRGTICQIYYDYYGDEGGGSYTTYTQCRDYFASGPTVYNGVWFTSSTPGFHGGDYHLGAASSISAYYNSYTKNYTSHGSSLTISGGGLYGRANPTLYVCN
jgi:hypothetical protein